MHFLKERCFSSTEIMSILQTILSRAAEMKDAADDVMGVLFDSLKVYSVTYDALHAYCMATGSFSALRALYTRFGEFVAPADRRIIARVIRDTRPRSDWESFLDPEDR